MPMWNWDYGMTGWPMVFWMVIILLGLLTLAGLLVWAVTRQNRTETPVGRANPSALEILRERYARGELDRAAYDEMRERLERTERPVSVP